MLCEVRGSSFEERNKIVRPFKDVNRVEDLLRGLNFVKVLGGVVRLGTNQPLPCKFEGHRVNETPVRELEIPDFWINRYTVSNREFEEFNPNRIRPQTSSRDRQPVTNVTYLNALRYAKWMSEKYDLAFSLPNKPEWVYVAAPFGWEYPYQPGRTPISQKTHNFLINESEYSTIDIDDLRYGTNFLGLFHMGGNVQEFTLGSYYTDSGAWGAATDGRYCIVRGGDFGHCPLSSGVQRRAIFDIAARSERISFRLMHPALETNE